MFGKNKIEKVLKVDGMACKHCAKKVEDCLGELDQVKKVKVSLENKEVKVILKEDVDVSVLENVITELGYTIIK